MSYVVYNAQVFVFFKTLQWRHNEHGGVSNHQCFDCLLNRLFRHRSKKTSKLRVTGFCEGNSPVTGEFPAQRASNAENVSIGWRHHDQRDPSSLDERGLTGRELRPLGKDWLTSSSGIYFPPVAIMRSCSRISSFLRCGANWIWCVVLSRK